MDHYLKLRRREQIFVDEYVATGSKTKAAQKIIPNSKFPRNVAMRMLAKTNVAEAIEERKAEAIEEAGITHLRTITELANVAYFRKPRGPDGTVLPLEQWPDTAMAAIASLEFEAEYEGAGQERKRIGSVVSKFRTWNKNEALKTLMQYQGLLVERHEHSGPGGKPLQPPNIAITFPDNGPGGAPPEDDGVETSPG